MAMGAGESFYLKPGMEDFGMIAGQADATDGMVVGGINQTGGQRYGFDDPTDGVITAEELAAYEAHKDAMELAQEAEMARARAYLDQRAAMNKSDYDTVPGFAARRGWHGNNLNEQNYGDELTPDHAVFPFNAHKDGSMAKFLHQRGEVPERQPDPLRGRSREVSGYYKEVPGWEGGDKPANSPGATKVVFSREGVYTR